MQALSPSEVHYSRLDCFGIMLCVLGFLILISLSPCNGNVIDSKLLVVGKELLKETLPLQSGFRLYQVQGLKSHTLYEVKISYPASIPAVFSLQLKRGGSESGLNLGRKLLNTEKLIFTSDSLDSLSNQRGTYVLVTVEPEGVVAIPGARERERVIYNIVCDELLLGIPHKAWYVVILALFCLALAFAIPSFLPPHLLPRNKSSATADEAASKDS